MRRLLSLFPILAFGLFLSLAACNDIPDYSPVPEIKIQSLKLKRGPGVIDTITLDLYFRDGDGDIGLNEEDKVGVFAKYLPGPTGDPDSSVLNPLYDNLSVSLFFWNKETLQYDSIPPTMGRTGRNTPLMQTRPYSGTIKPITTRKEPIEGTVRYYMQGTFYEDHFPGFPQAYPMTRSGEKFYIKVQLADRAQHSSARLQSALITVP